MKPVYVELNIIKNKPGNPRSTIRVRLDIVMAFGPCEEEYCKLGASSYVSCTGGEYICSDTYEELCKLIDDACREQVK